MAAIYNEDTHEEPKCPFCESTEDCGHLLADIDLTFGECYDGALCSHAKGLLNKIEAAFEKRYRNQRKSKFSDSDLQDLWEQTEFEVYVHLPFAGWPFLVELLEDAGAIEAEGPLIDDGDMPGSSSAVKRLYHDKPDELVERVKKNLQVKLDQQSDV